MCCGMNVSTVTHTHALTKLVPTFTPSHLYRIMQTRSCYHLHIVSHTLTKEDSYKNILTCVLTHMHTYTYVHTHLYTYTQPHTLTQNDHINTHTDIWAPIGINTHMFIHMYKHTSICTQKHSHMQLYIHTLTLLYTPRHSHSYSQVTHVYIHAHTDISL